VANNSLKNISEELRALCINSRDLTPQIKWEKNLNTGVIFPHVYGPINRCSIINTVSFEKDKKGDFLIPAELQNYSKF